MLSMTERAVARMAPVAAKLVIQLEAAGQTEAARVIRETAVAACDAMRAGAPSSAPTPDGISTYHMVALA